MSNIPARIVWLLRKHPRYVLRRAANEVRSELDRFLWPRRARSFGPAAILVRTQETGMEQLWQRLASEPWPVKAEPVDAAQFEVNFPGSSSSILERAEKACCHEVDLLGSGPTALGERIAWDTDFKTGDKWPTGYFRDIPVVDGTRPSDVKVPWELSRLQWLLPVGQAYLLTQNERYAAAALSVLGQWIDSNPVGQTVNWAIAMEPAMRIFVWTWLFRVFCRSESWRNETFRARFLCCLYQHAAFVARFIERADRNGNHYTADCAALVVAGAFFPGSEAHGWLTAGISELEREIALQFHEDGVNVEASTAYHRFVTEMFLIAAMHAEKRGLKISSNYKVRLAAAARFTAAYTRPDGSAPLWGDADDGRVLPFGAGPVNDHRHLIAGVAEYLHDDELARLTDGGREELFWLLGVQHLNVKPALPEDSASYPVGGVYILRSNLGHVFVDCGPVGFYDRGGHGHNDALSFEATLGGVNVIEESGCFVYTASFEERNLFRSTTAHNTPSVDGEEINRFVDPELLWSLHPDASPIGPRILPQKTAVVFEGAHSGYRRLSQPIVPTRRISLRRDGIRLTITDSFEGSGRHEIRIPLQLARGWSIQELLETTAVFKHVSGCDLRITWEGTPAWRTTLRQGRIAPSYGVSIPVPRLEWSVTDAARNVSLNVCLELRNP